MASQKAIIEQKLREIDVLKAEIENLNFLEMGRLYKSNEYRYLGPDRKLTKYTSWVLPIGFNKNTVRFKVVASELPYYEAEGPHRGSERLDTTKVSYNEMRERLVRVKKDELPLLLGLPFVSSRLEKIMHGTARVKLD